MHAAVVRASVTTLSRVDSTPAESALRRTMYRAEAAAAPSDHTSPTLGGPPSYVSNSVPLTAANAATHVRSPMRRSPSTHAKKGTRTALR